MPVLFERYWRVDCTTEGTFVYAWGVHEPTECPNDSGHTINSDETTAERRREEIETTTTDDTPTVVVSAEIPENTEWYVTVTCGGFAPSTGDNAAYRRVATIRRGTGSAEISRIISPVTVETVNDWNAELNVNGNNIEVTVTGDAVDTVNWKTRVEYTEAT